MIARSAYTQLRYSPWLLLGTVLGLVLTYCVPPVLGAAASAVQAWSLAIPCLAAWALLSLSYLPVLRLYRLSRWRAPLLPAVMAVYGAMTVDSARRHRQGRGGSVEGPRHRHGTRRRRSRATERDASSHPAPVSCQLIQLNKRIQLIQKT